MRARRLKKDHDPIDTSMLPFGKDVKVRDQKYKDSFRYDVCMICGRPATVVGAHVRKNARGGMGLKPSDDLMHALCFEHHMEEGAGEEKFWKKYFGWTIRKAHAVARARYQRWKNG